MGFLNQYGLSDEFKLNVECNHATLAGHSCDHELQVWSLCKDVYPSVPASSGLQLQCCAT